MKKILRAAAILLALVIAPSLACAADGAVLETPDFTVYDADGNAFTLADMLGRPVIVNMWATWCPPCCSELGYFNEAAQAYGEEIAFMMVDLADGSYETVAGAEAFVEENGYTFPVYYDTDYSAVNAYRVEAIPTSLFITADGRLFKLAVGAMEQEELQQYIEALLEASAVPAAEDAAPAH